MPYDFLTKDLRFTQKAIGTDRGLAKIGDAIVNLAYSVAKSIYLTKNARTNNVIRTGRKVSKTILSSALKNADMKGFARSRADAHDLADTVEAIVAYIWMNDKMSLPDIIDLLEKNLSGDLHDRINEIKSATEAFTRVLNHVKKFLPDE